MAGVGFIKAKNRIKSKNDNFQIILIHFMTVRK